MLNVDVGLELDLDVSGGVDRATRRYLQDAMQYGHSVASEEAPEDRGQLRRSIYPPEWSGDEIRFGATAPHARPIEEGTDPFLAPKRPLLEWGDRVAGDPGLGMAVWHKIRKEGIDAQPYMEPGAEAAKSWMERNDFSGYLEDEL